MGAQSIGKVFGWKSTNVAIPPHFPALSPIFPISPHFPPFPPISPHFPPFPPISHFPPLVLVSKRGKMGMARIFGEIPQQKEHYWGLWRMNYPFLQGAPGPCLRVHRSTGHAPPRCVEGCNAGAQGMQTRDLGIQRHPLLTLVL